MQLKTILGWSIKFTPAIFIVTADLWSDLINTAGPIRLDVFTVAMKHQVPVAFILIDLYSLMGYLPQQMVEVCLGARGYTQGFGGVGAALGAGTVETLVTRFYGGHELGWVRGC